MLLTFQWPSRGVSERGALGLSAFLGLAALNGVSVLYNIVVGRALGRAPLGTLGAILSAAIFFSSLVSFTGSAASKYASLRKGEGRDPYAIAVPMLLLTLSLGNAVFLASLLLSDKISSILGLAPPMIVLAGVVGALRGSFDSLRLLHLGLWEIKRYLVLVLLAVIAFWAVVPIALRGGMALLYPYITMYAVFLAASVTALLRTSSRVDWNILPVLKMSLFAGLGSIVSLLRYSLIPLLLNAVWGSVTAGGYVAASTIIRPFKAVPMLASQVLLPYYSMRAGEGVLKSVHEVEFKELLLPATSILFSLSLPLMGFVTAIIFGPQFSGLDPVSWLISLEVFLYSLNTMLLVMGVSYGRESLLLTVPLASMLVSAPLYAVLIGEGASGLALALLLGTAVSHVFLLRAVLGGLGIFDVLHYLPPALSATLSFLLWDRGLLGKLFTFVVVLASILLVERTRLRELYHASLRAIGEILWRRGGP